MTTAPIPAGYAEAVFRINSANFTDGYALTTMGLQLVSGDEQAAADLIGPAFATAIWTPAGFSGFVYDRCTVRSATAEGIHVSSTAGTASGAPLAVNGSLLVKKGTALLGRHNRGRMYIPGILDESGVDARGFINSSDVPSFQTKVDNFRTAYEDGSLVSVIIHANGSTPTTITRLVVESQIGTQRRRMRR